MSWSSKDVSKPIMGVVAENNILQASFIKAARANPNVECMFSTDVQHIDFPQSSSASSGNKLAEMQLDGGKTIQARLVSVVCWLGFTPMTKCSA